jgi:Secretion system C-terminal sorting domain
MATHDGERRREDRIKGFWISCRKLLPEYSKHPLPAEAVFYICRRKTKETVAMKFNLLLSILLVAFQYGISQPDITPAWAFPVGSFSTVGGEGIGGMDLDDEDNIYAIPILRDSTDLDPGTGEHLFIPTHNFGAPLVKYDKDGQLVWAHSFIGGDNSFGEVMEAAYNRIIVAISFTDSLIYDTGTQPTTLIRHEGASIACILLDLNGLPLSHIVLDWSHNAYFNNIITLPDQRILMAGAFEDTLSLGPGTPALISAGDYDGFFVMMNPDFSVAWARQFGGPGYDNIQDVKINTNRIAFAAGHEDTIHIETINGPITLSFNGDEDGAFGTLDFNGQFLNAFTIGGPESDNVRAIEIDADGNLYAAGYFQGSVNFAGPQQAPQVYTSWGSNDAFITKYSPNGDLQWNRVYTNNDYGGVYTLTLERNNELYASGAFAGRSDLNPGQDSLVVEEGFHSTSFLTKLNIDGMWKWSNWFRSEDNTGIRKVVVSTESNRIYMDGYFYSSMNCAILPDENYIYTHGFGSDAFFAAFDEVGVISSSHEMVITEALVFPNPTSGQITIQAEEEIKELEVLTASGKSIRILKSGSNSITFNMATLPAGIYYVKLHFSGRQEIRKVIRL